jgi:hypothetical protein
VRKISESYEIITHESAAEGVAAENGWIDEEGTAISPDTYDLDETEGDETLAAVRLAVKHITQHGGVEASSSRWHSGLWYSYYDETGDYATGDRENRSFHLSGFSELEERHIFDALTKKAAFRL